MLQIIGVDGDGGWEETLSTNVGEVKPLKLYELRSLDATASKRWRGLRKWRLAKDLGRTIRIVSQTVDSFRNSLRASLGQDRKNC
jgi:hypothetical protein